MSVLLLRNSPVIPHTLQLRPLWKHKLTALLTDIFSDLPFTFAVQRYDQFAYQS